MRRELNENSGGERILVTWLRGLRDLPLIIKWMKGHDQDYCRINLLLH